MPTEEEVIDVLKEIIDPHANVSVYDLGLIRNLKVTKNSVSLTFVPTSPFCPLGVHLAMNIKRRIRSLKGVTKADVTIQGHVQEKTINAELARN